VRTANTGMPHAKGAKDAKEKEDMAVSGDTGLQVVMSKRPHYGDCLTRLKPRY
jgi:hypothetical protein